MVLQPELFGYEVSKFGGYNFVFLRERDISNRRYGFVVYPDHDALYIDLDGGGYSLFSVPAHSEGRFRRLRDINNHSSIAQIVDSMCGLAKFFSTSVSRSLEKERLSISLLNALSFVERVLSNDGRLEIPNIPTLATGVSP